MFVRTLDELRWQGREKVLLDGKARSARLLTAADGLGFSFADVGLAAGAGEAYELGGRVQAAAAGWGGDAWALYVRDGLSARVPACEAPLKLAVPVDWISTRTVLAGSVVPSWVPGS